MPTPTPDNTKAETTAPGTRANATPAAGAKPPRKKRRLLRWAIVALAVLALLAASAPTLLSTGPGRGLLASVVNGQIRGAVKFNELSLGWFSPISAGGVTVRDPQGRQVLTIAQVRGDRGLWRLLASGGEEIGQLSADSAAADLFANADGTFSLQEAFEPRTKKASKPNEPAGKLSVTVTWSKARVRAVQPDGREYHAVSEAAGRLTVKSLNDVSAELTAMLAGGSKLTASASLANFSDPATGQFTLDKATGQLQVRAEPAVNLQPVFTFFTAGGDAKVRGQGKLAIDAKGELAAGKGSASYNISIADVSATTQPGSAPPLDGQIKGELTVENGTLNSTNTLAGPKLGQVKVNVRYAMGTSGRSAEGVTVEKIMAALTEGKSLELPDFSLNATGRLDMAAAAQSVPGLLPLRPGVEVSAGSLDLNDIQVSGGASPAASGAIKLSLTTRRPGQPIKIWQPYEARLKLTSDAKARLTVEQAEAKTPFANLTAHGTLPQLEGQFNADLAAARRELDEVFDLDQIAMSGTVAGTLKAAESTDQAGRVELAFGVDLTGVACGKLASAGEPPSTYTGRVEWAGAIRNDPAAKRFMLEGTGSIPKLTRTTPGPNGSAKGAEHFDMLGGDKFALKHNITYDFSQPAGRLTIGEFKIDSKLLTLSVDKGGTISDLAGKCLLNLSGSYRMSWPEAMALLKRLSPAAAGQLALAGDSASKVTLTGPISNPNVANTLGDVTGGAGVDWHSGSKAVGILLGDMQFAPTIKNGRILVPTKSTSANGGTLSLGCYIDLTGRDPMAGADKDPVLVIEGDLNALDNVALNDEVGRQLLSRVLPLFGELSQLEGKVSLRLKDVHVPLSGRITKVGRGGGRLDMSGVHLAPAGEFGRLFKLLGGGVLGKYAVTISPFDFQLRDGGLSFENLTITFAAPVGLDLRFRGLVKFDDSVNIVMSVPVRPALLEGLGVIGPVSEYVKALGDVRIDIPLTGSRLNPKMDLSKVKEIVPKLIEQALKKMGGAGKLPLPKFGPLPPLPKF